MTANFWTKIAINAYIRISTRDNENVITYNRGFSWSGNPKKAFLHGSKERCHGNQILAKIGKRYDKNGHNFSCMQHILAEFGFEIGLCYEGIHLWQSRTQWTKGGYHGNQFWTKIAINAFLRETTRM